MAGQKALVLSLAMGQEVGTRQELMLSSTYIFCL